MSNEDKIRYRQPFVGWRGKGHSLCCPMLTWRDRDRPRLEVDICGTISVLLSLGNNLMAETPTGSQAADGIGSSVVIPTNGPSSSPALPEQDDEVERLRGVVALPHHRDILFSDEVELDTATLPRWRPHINVDERRLTDDDHA